MITYVDTSALVKLIVEEPGSDRARAVWDGSDDVVSVVLAYAEARAALAAARGRRVTSSQHRRAVSTLDDLWAQLGVVEVTTDLAMSAGALAEREGLRGYDAAHLATALLVGADVFASADAELCEAASRNGMSVANPLEGPT